MASSIIHMAVASEVNKRINRDETRLLIGTIAPDLSKLVGEDKIASHFLYTGMDGVPDTDRFFNKYRYNFNDDFVLGYYIHLLTDYYWFKYFISEVLDDDTITKLDGEKIKCSHEMMSKYIYNDYTNLNIKLIDEYNLNLKIFYNKLPEFENIIDEIPMDKINLVVDKAGEIIKATKVHKDMVFNIENVKKFITTTVDLILADLKAKKII